MSDTNKPRGDQWYAPEPGEPSPEPEPVVRPRHNLKITRIDGGWKIEARETGRIIREFEQSLDRALADDERAALRRTFSYSMAELHDALWRLLWFPRSLLLRVRARWVRMYWRRKMTRGER